jgi:hypothetical protein
MYLKSIQLSPAPLKLKICTFLRPLSIFCLAANLLHTNSNTTWNFSRPACLVTVLGSSWGILHWTFFQSDCNHGCGCPTRSHYCDYRPRCRRSTSCWARSEDRAYPRAWLLSAMLFTLKFAGGGASRLYRCAPRYSASGAGGSSPHVEYVNQQYPASSPPANARLQRLFTWKTESQEDGRRARKGRIGQ